MNQNNMNIIEIRNEKENILTLEIKEFKEWIKNLCSTYTANEYDEEKFIGICVKDIQLVGHYKTWNYYTDLTKESRNTIENAIKEYYKRIL